jgi:hypothetical protein
MNVSCSKDVLTTKQILDSIASSRSQNLLNLVFFKSVFNLKSTLTVSQNIDTHSFKFIISSYSVIVVITIYL